MIPTYASTVLPMTYRAYDDLPIPPRRILKKGFHPEVYGVLGSLCFVQHMFGFIMPRTTRPEMLTKGKNCSFWPYPHADIEIHRVLCRAYVFLLLIESTFSGIEKIAVRTTLNTVLSFTFFRCTLLVIKFVIA